MWRIREYVKSSFGKVVEKIFWKLIEKLSNFENTQNLKKFCDFGKFS